MGNYVIENYIKGIFNRCPAPSCTGGGKDTYIICRHFAWKHPKSSITISGDRGVNACDKFRMKCYDLTRHRDKSTCKKLQTQRRNEHMQDRQAEAENIAFAINNKRIERAHHFKYL